MSGSSFREDDAINGINVTPLVDVVLVLLVVFMVTGRMMVSQVIPFELPPGITTNAIQPTFVVTVDPAGNVAADGRAVDDAGLRRAAQDAQAKHRDLRTVIHAAALTHHRNVVHVLDELRRVGVTRVAFGVEKKP